MRAALWKPVAFDVYSRRMDRNWKIMERAGSTDGLISVPQAMALVVAAVLLVGCNASGPVIPKGWRSYPIDSVLMNSRRDDEPRLQVIICYGLMISHHSDLRVTCPDRRPVFWDPGGDYKEKEWGYKRRHDVMYEHSPDLFEWWRHRSKQWDEPFMKVFEWDLTRHDAERLHTEILKGCNNPGAFKTQTMGGFCNIAVCDYLQRFAKPRIDIPEKMIWPNSLAEHLWTQRPNRVLVFEANKSMLIYEPLRIVQQPKS